MSLITTYAVVSFQQHTKIVADPSQVIDSQIIVGRQSSSPLLFSGVG